MSITRLGFIGFGKLARCIWAGCSDYLKERDITCYYSKQNPETEAISDLHFTSTETIVENCDLVILAVKPAHLVDVLPKLRYGNWTKNCLVSVLAGTPLPYLQEKLPTLSQAIRVMPNTSAHQRESMTVTCSLESTQDYFQDFTLQLFKQLGAVLEIDEKHMDFCTALCGSGPAFFYALLQGLLDSCVDKGFSHKQARYLVNQLIQGISASVNARPESFNALINEVKSPKGTTEAGLTHLDSLNLSAAFKEVFLKAEQRASEISRSL